MNPKRFKRLIRREIDQLRRDQLIDSETHTTLLSQYPVDNWDYSALGRWFLIFGAIAFACGVGILGVEIFEFTLQRLAILLGVVVFAGLYAGRVLANKNLVWAGRSAELLGALAIIGLTFTLGVIYSTGSGNWPALLLIDMLILLPLAYLLRNVLLLVLNVIVFFTWFGGVTGYVSGWGAYWFSMNYPMRFLIAGLLMAGMAFVHRSAEQNRLRAFEGFFKVWLSGGIFFSEMSLWLMSLFGNFGSIYGGYRETAAELFIFNVLWAGFNVLLLQLGSRYQLRMLRGYAVTFFVIQAYTLYFWKIAGALGGVLATFIAGAATLGIVVYFESRRRAAKA